MDDLTQKLQQKLNNLSKKIVDEYTEIDNVRIKVQPTENRSGNSVGSKLFIEVESTNELIDHSVIELTFLKGLAAEPLDCILRSFKRSYQNLLTRSVIHLTDDNFCGTCDLFLGGGDFGLCCKIYNGLCYQDTPACRNYKSEH